MAANIAHEERIREIKDFMNSNVIFAKNYIDQIALTLIYDIIFLRETVSLTKFLLKAIENSNPRILIYF